MNTHTYTVHVQIGAHNDAEAVALGHLIKAMVENEPAFPLTPNEYRVDSLHVTDADDWAEQVSNGGFATCGICGVEDGTHNRVRVGDGSRYCAECLAADTNPHHDRPYVIEEAYI